MMTTTKLSWPLWISLACLFTLALMFCSGCNSHTVNEQLTISKQAPDGTVTTLTYDSNVGQWFWLYYSSMKQVEHITPLSSTCVGEMESQPDSIEEAGDALSPLMMLIK